MNIYNPIGFIKLKSFMHFGPDDYAYLIGYQFVDSNYTHITINSIEFDPDDIYFMTDGRAGNMFFVKLSNGKNYHIRNINEVFDIYGEPKKPNP